MSNQYLKNLLDFLKTINNKSDDCSEYNLTDFINHGSLYLSVFHEIYLHICSNDACEDKDSDIYAELSQCFDEFINIYNVAQSRVRDECLSDEGRNDILMLISNFSSEFRKYRDISGCTLFADRLKDLDLDVNTVCIAHEYNLFDKGRVLHSESNTDDYMKIYHSSTPFSEKSLVKLSSEYTIYNFSILPKFVTFLHNFICWFLFLLCLFFGLTIVLELVLFIFG